MSAFKSRIGEAQHGGALSVAMLMGFLALSVTAILTVGPSQGIARREPVAPYGTILVPLPITIEPGQSHRELARRILKEDTFMALALGVESSPEHAYVDAAGANAGAGYCVEMRRRALGELLVRSELSKAGFPQNDIESLLSRNKSRIKEVRVGQAQSLRLLMISKPQYQAMARKAVGAAVFDALPSHKKDVLSYLAYNTGEPKKFVKLIDAVRSGDDATALAQMAPSVLVGQGKRVKNHRLRAWAQAAWIGKDELKKALEKPVAFELSYANKAGQDRFIKVHAAVVFDHAKYENKAGPSSDTSAHQIMHQPSANHPLPKMPLLNLAQKRARQKLKHASAAAHQGHKHQPSGLKKKQF